MQSSRALFFSVVAVALSAVGGVTVYLQSADAKSSTAIAGQAISGEGLIFPACGSASATTWCNGTTAEAAVSWTWDSYYKDFVSISGDMGSAIIEAETFVTSHTFTGLSPNTYYNCTIEFAHGTGDAPVDCSFSTPTTCTVCSPLTGSSCTSTANACGQTNTGTYQCDGTCSASTPSNPANFGTACTSAPNACGQTNTGTYQCNGTCSATTPPNTSCTVGVPPLLTAACNASGTSAHMTWGTATGATSYILTMNVGASASCPSGWTWGTYVPGSNYCYRNVGLATSYDYPTTIGDSYSAWVRVGTPLVGDPSNEILFSCPPPAPTFSAACSTGNTGHITWTQVTGAEGYQAVVNIGDLTSCPSGWTFASYSAGNNYCYRLTGLSGSTGTVSAPAADFAGMVDGKSYVAWGRTTNMNQWSPPVQVDGPPSNVASFSTASCTRPDLTATNTTPTSATAGVAVTLSATINNAATGAATGASFQNFFQLDTDTNHTSGNEINVGIASPNPMPALAAGGSNTATRSYTFASAGTYYTRVCADKSSATDLGDITESNENNNCSPQWTTVTATTGSGTPSLTCSRSPSTNSLPAPATVTYTVVPIDGAAAPFTFRNALSTILHSGSSLTYTTTYSSPGSYAVTVGASNVSPPVACDAALTVTDPEGPCGAADADISANPTRLPTAGPTHVSWTASGIDANESCIITKNGVDPYTVQDNGACGVTNVSFPGGDPTVSEQTRFCISCDSDDQLSDPGYDCVTVSVDSEFNTF